MAKQPVSFNTYQQAVVSFRKGYAVVMAAPGSGKTAVITARIKALLSEGVAPEEILSLTFTKEGAKEMTERAGLDIEHKLFSTFHSWALAFIKKEYQALPFKVRTDFHGLPNPLLLPQESARMLVHICRGISGIQWKDAASFISLCKRRGFNPEQAAEMAQDEKEEAGAIAFAKYEHAMSAKGVLDFDSILIETAKLLERNPIVRARWQYRFVMCDEGQDTDNVQMRVLRSITEKYGNLLMVGDENQCHPDGTKIRRVVKAARGCLKAITDDIAIETIPKKGTNVQTWTKQDHRVYGAGRAARRCTRFYSGELIGISAGNNFVEVTPAHWMWVRFAKTDLEGKHFVYVMFKEGLGYRVGTSFFRHKKYGGCFAHRAQQERANKVWVLKLFPDQKSARRYETIVSLKYGVPETTFRAWSKSGFSQTDIQAIFDSVPASHGINLLEDHGLVADSPLYENDYLLGRKYQKYHGWFKTAAANVLPIVMEVPSTKPYKAVTVKKCTRRLYVGTVHSLDVERDHTYIANGIPVGNCMYSWRGAVDNMVNDFKAMFPSTIVFPLPVNYRSTGAIISYCKEIAPHKNETITKLTGVKDHGIAPVFKLFTLEKDEAKYVVNASVDLGNTAILARTNAQLLPFENECNDRQLRYRLLGKSGFWAQHEIKDAVAIVGCCVAPSDNAVLRMLSSRCDATKFLRKSDTHDRPSTITMLKRHQASMLAGTNGKPPLLHRIMANFDTGDPSQNEVLRNLSYMMHSLRVETEKLSGKDAMMRVIDRFGMLSAYDVEEDEDDKKNFDNDPRANILKLADYAQLKGGLAGLHEYIQKVNKARHARTDCLTLSTIHQSKGKEWKKVFVVGVVDEILPHIKGDPEEEARIFFVACSRAAETLTVTASGVPSLFIANLVKVPGGENNGLLVDEWEGFRLQG